VRIPVPKSFTEPVDFFRIWRVWAEGRATLAEIREHWTIDDVADANDMIDYMAAIGRGELV
jgi:hypothetical protein